MISRKSTPHTRARQSARTLDHQRLALLCDALGAALHECDTLRLRRVPLPRPLAVELLAELQDRTPDGAA